MEVLATPGNVLDQHVTVRQDRRQQQCSASRLPTTAFSTSSSIRSESVRTSSRRSSVTTGAPARPTSSSSSRADQLRPQPSRGGARSGRISCHVHGPTSAPRAPAGSRGRCRGRRASLARHDLAHHRPDAVVEVEGVRVAAGEAPDEALELQQRELGLRRAAGSAGRTRWRRRPRACGCARRCSTTAISTRSSRYA